MRFTSLGALPTEWRPGLLWLVAAASTDDLQALEHLHSSGLDNIYVMPTGNFLPEACPFPVVFVNTEKLEPGDVLAITPGHSKLQVLYRESDMHHTIFLTNRCNSRCLMCSQPPTSRDDSWLIEEAKQVALHIHRSPPVLGFTGGEPLLLGQALREVIDTFVDEHPNTRFEILTNGRGFSDHELAMLLLTALPAQVSWMVPLYGHADFLHDHVVQSEGAFDQTINGLLTLHAFKQPIQLRIVLIKPVLQVLPELCRFITRNLPFVREVALMGCEPIGYALANRAVCEVNLAEWSDTLAQAVRCLTRTDVPPVLMNIPLCALESDLRPFAHRSISDWKQVYAPECGDCQMRKDCCGLFASALRGWRPAVIQPMREIA
jgi:His-Xaa-Ser system radical SAM maturase HxsC